MIYALHACMQLNFASVGAEAYITSTSGALENAWDANKCPAQAAIKVDRGSSAYTDRLALDCKASGVWDSEFGFELRGLTRAPGHSATRWTARHQVSSGCRMG